MPNGVSKLWSPSEMAILLYLSHRADNLVVYVECFFHIIDLLTSNLQERALTTIVYLMSLTSVSNAPFSLVDEINQGMDARNERAVLSELFRVVCESNSSQCVVCPGTRTWGTDAARL